jgi:diketogulonate reductase-like aldo/keto reductase
MDSANIRIEAYGPLCPLFRSEDGPVDEVVFRIANKHKFTEGQTLLAWARQHGGGGVVTLVSVLAKMLVFSALLT